MTLAFTRDVLSFCVFFASLLYCGGTTKIQIPANLPLLGGLVEDISKEYPDEPQPAVEQAIVDALTLGLDNEKMTLNDVACNRDYSTPCPEGWADMGDGMSCLAPSHYRGNCPNKMSYGKLTPREKNLRASECEAVFPCIGAIVPDYHQSCPLGWTEGLSYECIAPSNYSGPCLGRKKFAHWNVAEKSSWAEACGVSWPPRKSHQANVEINKFYVNGGMFNADCVVDYTDDCPHRWTITKPQGSCQAPVDYSGMCGFFVASATFTPQQKQAYAEACNAFWPCMKDVSMMFVSN